jgi:hypothetical protein
MMDVMTAKGVPGGPDREVLGAVATAARERGGEWFPDMDPRKVELQLLARDARPRCFLYRVLVSDGRQQRVVVVKVRHSIPELRRLELFEQRHVLARERTLSDLDTARREYDGLRLISEVFGPLEGAQFGVLRPLAWLPDHTTIVMEQVTEATLRDVLLEGSRARPSLPLDTRPWISAGAWLRIWHDAPTELTLTLRDTTRNDVVELFREYGDFLAERTGDRRFFTGLVAAAEAHSSAYLPRLLPLGLSHGDYVTRNMFASSSGRLTVFDPMPLWRVPIYEDLARFVMIGLRLVDVQLLTPGRKVARERLNACEQGLLDGYFGEGATPYGAVRTYQLLLLLDKWSETVSKVTRKPGRRYARAGVVALWNRRLRREAQRLLGLLAEDTPRDEQSEPRQLDGARPKK